MNINIKIGGRIKDLRNSLQISQEELSYKSGIDRSYIAGVETGQRNVTVKVLEKIILSLDTDIISFFNHPIFNNE